MRRDLLAQAASPSLLLRSACELNVVASPGPDGKTPRDLFSDFPTSLIRARQNLFLPGRVPDPIGLLPVEGSSTGTRELHIQNVADKLADKAVYVVAERILEPRFHTASYAFRKGRGPGRAIRRAILLIVGGRHFASSLDIEKCFPSISHGLLSPVLIDAFRGDVRFVDAGTAYLRSSLVLDGRTTPVRERGIREGCILSPLWSNAFLDLLDRHLAALGVTFIRYGDNVLVLARTWEQCSEGVLAAEEFLRTRLGLRLKSETMGIVDLREGQVGFLGFDLDSRGARVSEETLGEIAGVVLAEARAARPAGPLLRLLDPYRRYYRVASNWKDFEEGLVHARPWDSARGKNAGTTGISRMEYLLSSTCQVTGMGRNACFCSLCGLLRSHWESLGVRGIHDVHASQTYGSSLRSGCADGHYGIEYQPGRTGLGLDVPRTEPPVGGNRLSPTGARPNQAYCQRPRFAELFRQAWPGSGTAPPKLLSLPVDPLDWPTVREVLHLAKRRFGPVAPTHSIVLAILEGSRFVRRRITSQDLLEAALEVAFPQRQVAITRFVDRGYKKFVNRRFRAVDAGGKGFPEAVPVPLLLRVHHDQRKMLDHLIELVKAENGWTSFSRCTTYLCFTYLASQMCPARRDLAKILITLARRLSGNGFNAKVDTKLLGDPDPRKSMLLERQQFGSRRDRPRTNALTSAIPKVSAR